MKERILVSTIMAKDVITVNVTDSLTKADQLFKEHKIRHIPVVSGKHIVGILSHSDILRIAIPDINAEGDAVVSKVYDMYTLEQVMTKNVKTLQQDDFIKTAALVFTENDFRALPIVDAENNLVGILSTTDLIKFLLAQFNG